MFSARPTSYNEPDRPGNTKVDTVKQQINGWDKKTLNVMYVCVCAEMSLAPNTTGILTHCSTTDSSFSTSTVSARRWRSTRWHLIFELPSLAVIICTWPSHTKTLRIVPMSTSTAQESFTMPGLLPPSTVLTSDFKDASTSGSCAVECWLQLYTLAKQSEKLLVVK